MPTFDVLERKSISKIPSQLTVKGRKNHKTERKNEQETNIPFFLFLSKLSDNFPA